jgi:hypothetical protein
MARRHRFLAIVIGLSTSARTVQLSSEKTTIRSYIVSLWHSLPMVIEALEQSDNDADVGAVGRDSRDDSVETSAKMGYREPRRVRP